MNKRDEKWKVKFIEELRARGVVEEACIAAGISMSTAYVTRKKALMSRALGASEANGSTALTICDFATEWDDAIREAVERNRAEHAHPLSNRLAVAIRDPLPRRRVRQQRPRLPNGSWQDEFIAELRRRGVVLDAARAAHIDVTTAYNARRKAIAMRAAGASGADDGRESSMDFALRWDEAIEEAVGSLEEEVWRRGMEGVKEPVFYRGRKVGEIRRYSDGLLILLLKAHRPRKYRDNAQPTRELPPETRALLEKYYEAAGRRLREG